MLDSVITFFVPTSNSFSAFSEAHDHQASPAPAPEPTSILHLWGAPSGKQEVQEEDDTVKDFGFSMEELEPMLWTLLVILAIAAIIFECVHRRWSDVDFTQPATTLTSNQGQTTSLLTIFRGVWPLMSPYCCRGGTRGKVYFFVVLLRGLSLLFANFSMNIWQKEWFDCLQRKDVDQFVPLLVLFCLVATFIIVVGTYSTYIQSMLIIDWRANMTAYLQDMWLAHKVYYHLQLEPGLVDNPDQRIQEDANLFVQTVIVVTFGFLSAMGNLCVFLPILIYISPPMAFGVYYLPGWLIYIAAVYSLIGSLCTHFIGSQLILLGYSRQRYEADFRYAVVQIRDHAEGIALYGAERTEQDTLRSKFDKIKRIWWETMMYSKRLGFFQAFYGQTGYLFPFFVLAPNYFKGQITLGTLFQITSALGNVKNSFDWFVNTYVTIADFRGTVDRLNNFIDAMDTKKKTAAVERLDAPPPGFEDQGHGDAPPPGFSVVAKGISVNLPPTGESRTIWKNTDLIVRPGEFVLLTAPEGTGKSCFFRALAGIWPYANGSAYFQGTKLFLPQKSYIPQGPLKQAVAYPEVADRYTDEEVRDALRMVKLHAVAEKDLDESANWSMQFSGGEQQRLALARVVLRKPMCLFMDEATSAVGKDGTLELYDMLRREGVLPKGASLVTISHKVDLLTPVHDTKYAYEDGQWIKK
jgi:putative ATP-binding cassette transporter